MIELPRPEELSDNSLAIDPDSRTMKLILEGGSERRWREVDAGMFIGARVTVRSVASYSHGHS